MARLLREGSRVRESGKIFPSSGGSPGLDQGWQIENEDSSFKWSTGISSQTKGSSFGKSPGPRMERGERRNEKPQVAVVPR
jgi:hypothetical protein